MAAGRVEYVIGDVEGHDRRGRRQGGGRGQLHAGAATADVGHQVRQGTGREETPGYGFIPTRIVLSSVDQVIGVRMTMRVVVAVSMMGMGHAGTPDRRC
ncbi:hypothetical protein GCM10009682_56110 [Luedemannella flava]|uniref:Uncharacterized protein n=1 Tax=Luedemannella flava TaxID=349316 RepID=A0ABP4Z0B7_9ACTN